ncbi:MAG: YicC/YloC family endoribonuclease [Oligoflexales bacterium]
MTIRSMTSFASVESRHPEGTVRCDVKTLNSRFIEVNVRLPNYLKVLEVGITNHIKETLHRGKIDVFIDVQGTHSIEDGLKLDEEKLQYYADIFSKTYASVHQTLSDLSYGTVRDLLQMPGVLNTEGRASSAEQSSVWEEPVMATLKQSLAEVIKMRETEGSRLVESLGKTIELITNHRTKIEEHRPELQTHLIGNYQKRVEKLLEILAKGTSAGTDLTAQRERLSLEIAILTDKSDIQEELTRLSSHELEFLATLTQTKPAGRKLDFLCQELHREINTISAKVSHLSVSADILAIKQGVEQLRQQVQNIE